MVAEGARTLYLQSSNADRIGPFVYPDETATFIEAGHDRGVQVVAWYLPHPKTSWSTRRGPGRPSRSRPPRRSVRRIRPGHRVRPRARSGEADRAAREALDPAPRGRWRPIPARRDRALAGAAGRRRRVLAEVPGRHRAHLRRGAAHDVLTFRVHGPRETDGYVSRAIDEIRAGVGSDDVPIHVIGGLARRDRARDRGVRASRAERQGDRGSHYTLPHVTDEQWSLLRGCPQRPIDPLAPPPIGCPGPSDLLEAATPDVDALLVPLASSPWPALALAFAACTKTLDTDGLEDDLKVQVARRDRHHDHCGRLPSRRRGGAGRHVRMHGRGRVRHHVHDPDHPAERPGRGTRGTSPTRTSDSPDLELGVTVLLEGKRFLITGVLTPQSIAFAPRGRCRSTGARSY